MTGIDKILNEEYGDHHRKERPGKVSITGNSHQPGCTTDIWNIEDRDADDFAQSQCGNCQIIALQSQRWQTDGKAQYRSSAGAS